MIFCHLHKKSDRLVAPPPATAAQVVKGVPVATLGASIPAKAYATLPVPTSVETPVGTWR
jgi:hypothetical protein